MQLTHLPLSLVSWFQCLNLVWRGSTSTVQINEHYSKRNSQKLPQVISERYYPFVSDILSKTGPSVKSGGAYIVPQLLNSRSTQLPPSFCTQLP